jgi:hypothetical protein
VAACLAKGWTWNAELNRCIESKTFCGGKGQPACN